ncbi:MAG: Zn-ribbon domain-containing OB-fold protein [Deltaproteobacteria bacterium]|nr:MAG: Zn-ribbon domain-containing OB-fold protein [Deltaproteobacteria bacterium]
MSDARPFTTHSYFQYLEEGKLMGTYNASSDTMYVPPRPICPQTHSTEMEWRECSGKGTLAAFTAVSIGLKEMGLLGYSRNNPYVSGIVELEEGPKVSALIRGVDGTNPSSISIGTPMKVTFVKMEIDETQRTLLAFEPA